MLRINLLPPYIYDKNKKRNLVFAWAGMVGLVVAGFVIALASINAQLAQANTDKETAQTHKDAYDKYVTNIANVNTQIADTKAKQDFVANAQVWNNAWPATYEMMRDLTSDQILLKNMALDPASRKTLNFAGFSRSEMNIVRWWMILRNNKDKFDSVNFKLPTPAAPLQVASAGGAGGYGGYAAQYGGAGFGSKKGGPVGVNGGSSGGGGAAGEVGAGEVEGRPGINFTANAVLKQALANGLTLPSWGTAGAAAASSSGGGGGYGASYMQQYGGKR